MCWSPQGFQELIFPLVEERIIAKQIFGSQENGADFFFCIFLKVDCIIFILCCFFFNRQYMNRRGGFNRPLDYVN